MECAICLADLCPETEAYLLPACYHCFHFDCINRWTQLQQSHPINGSSSPPLCPLCKRPYSAIIYECIGQTFKCHELEAGRGIFPDCPLPKLLSLSAAQQRRRSIYMRWQESTAAPLHLRTRARQARHTPDSPAVSEFLTRELQALLLQQDVELVLQHVLGTMRSAGTPPACSTSGTGRSRLHHNRCKQTTSCKRPRHADPEPGVQELWVTAVSAGAQLFLHEHSQAFAQELYRFVEAGLSVRAYDAAGMEARQDRQAQDVEPHQTAAAAEQRQDLDGPGRDSAEGLDVDEDAAGPQADGGHSFGLVGEGGE